MKTHVFIINGTDPFRLLQNSILSFEKKENVSFEIIERDKIKQEWNKKTSDNLILVTSNYYIEKEDDSSTVLRFMQSLLKENEPKYYAPRPNSYIAQKNAYLWGVPFHAKWNVLSKTDIKAKLMPLFHSLPNIIKQKIRQTTTYINYRKSKQQQFTSTQCLPSFLQGLEVNKWQEWKNESALKRDLLERSHLFFPHPHSIHVAVSNKCNLKCVMCPYHSPIYRSSHTTSYFDDEKFLPIEAFSRIADYAGKNKISLQFGQIEEPLLHPNIFDFISLAKSKGVPYIHLTTNGTLLNKDRVMKLANSNVNSVMFSIDSTEPKTYQKIRGASLINLEKKYM